MRMWKAALALALIALPLGVSTAAQAQQWAPNANMPYFDTRGWVEQFNRRLNFISARVDEAIAERRVNWREARGLRAQRDHLRDVEREALADRYITRPERERLESELGLLARRLRIDVRSNNW
ncbi:hypothetical protein [Roseiterribacter gracilis]|uniref:Uncharacterized protein n=1 Tax=Roseiterribacter gracilis TaxID=2812848 RepID=A0A8S8X8K1_9PROT|nr:hypothetical protein TMPK1_12410 [Rhodospirillales bacterium TMPK1]